jgi:hypothetical protein
MDTAELKAACERQIELAGDDASVTLTLPGRWGARETRRLWPSGPSGRIVSESIRDGRACIVVQAPAREVLDALSQVSK